MVVLILKDRENGFIENKSNDELNAIEERKAFENANAQEELKINSDENSYLRRLLFESFSNKMYL